jgi:hypothetical protein
MAEAVPAMFIPTPSVDGAERSRCDHGVKCSLQRTSSVCTVTVQAVPLRLQQRPAR